MAGRIRRSDIDEVRSRTNIADVIGEYVTLRDAGIGAKKGLCPFHEERTPSFHVRHQVGFYHCFGCGEGGDVYTFLQKIEHVSFTEAVEMLAARIGYQLQYEQGSGHDEGESSGRARILEANAIAQQFFVDQLSSNEASAARRLLLGRGFDQDVATQYTLGYAPKGWDSLTKHLRSAGFGDEELSAAGLVSTGGRGVYDRFRGRLIWPIHDVTGQTIGFGARKLYDDDQGPKYLNTPETAVYHKSKVLYGLDHAKRDIAKLRQVVVVEGYTDVMACHLAGITTAVATCGTAFGSDHITLIRRIMSDDASRPAEVIFTFDPDAAGQKAALRAFADERRFVAQTYVAVAPDGLDPSDLRQERGDQAVRDLLPAKQPMFEFVIRQVIGRFDLNSVEGRIAALRQAAPIIAEIRDSAVKPAYARQLAGWLGIDVDEVAHAVARAGVDTRTQQEVMNPGGAASPGPEAVQGGDRAARPAVNLSDPTTRLEWQTLVAIIQYPDLLGPGVLDRVLDVEFTTPTLSAVQSAIAATPDFVRSPGRAELVLEQLPDAFAPLLREIAVTPMPVAGGEAVKQFVTGIVNGLLELDLTKRKADLLGRLRRTDRASDPSGYDIVSQQLMSLEIQRRQLME